MRDEFAVQHPKIAQRLTLGTFVEERRVPIGTQELFL
jgi:hypothetical protein